ncbi:uncharacterized protein LY79DRAFT_547605 [Colletotrichum navitas]|uniref:Uncharacterized protein n=1 Tax=Colletotrichum navitas TaxID=681940 RepID=A0AAD8Q2Z0_9PEZI|nr:uncharacterized protein LY79DRAFT_547605 [Colletotrichum navitas]KAK1594946.1 hypothetical protein LY79DRAFT_547605 [Colletotrichum navitas]
MATLSGAERIRAITDEDGMFKAFDTYPWKKDKAFMSGLNAILGDPNTENPQGSPTDLAIHARIFYYSQRIGVAIDFTKYQDWLARHPAHTPPDILPEEYKARDARGAASADDVPGLTLKMGDLSTGKGKEKAADVVAASESTPSWQAAAPKADLYVERKPSSQADAPSLGGDEPAYPIGFAQMLEMIQKGIPIPGIRQIPDTVVRDAVGSLHCFPLNSSPLLVPIPADSLVCQTIWETCGAKETLGEGYIGCRSQRGRGREASCG